MLQINKFTDQFLQKYLIKLKMPNGTKKQLWAIYCLSITELINGRNQAVTKLTVISMLFQTREVYFWTTKF